MLLPFTVGDLRGDGAGSVNRRRPVKAITMARADLNTGGVLYRGSTTCSSAPRATASSRYELAVEARRERQSSSGIIVSTGLGSTGWLRSIHAGWAAATAALTGTLPAQGDGSFAWDADQLRYSVREPFPSRTTGATLVAGTLGRGTAMTVTSAMPEGGVVFRRRDGSGFPRLQQRHAGARRLAERQGRLVA